MGDRANIVLVPAGEEHLNIESLEKHPQTIILYTHWGGREALQTVQEGLKKLGTKVTNPQEWVKFLTDYGFSKEEELTVADHANILIRPDEKTVGFSGGGQSRYPIEMPDFSFREIRYMPEKMLEFVYDTASDKDYLEWIHSEYEKTEPYRSSQRADEQSSVLVAGIPILLAGLGGLAAYFRGRP